MRTLITTLISLIYATAFAQDKTTPAFSQQDPKPILLAVTAGLNGFGLSGEWNAHHHFTVETTVSYGPSSQAQYDYYVGKLLPSPQYTRPAARFAVMPRWYFSRRKSLQSGEAETFLSFQFAWLTKPSNTNVEELWNASYVTSVNLGVRKLMSRSWLMNSYFGVGRMVNTNTKRATIFPSFNVSFGYRLNK